MRRRVVFTLFVTSFLFFSAMAGADEKGCLMARENMMKLTEDAKSSVRVGNFCRAADDVEAALNLLVVAEEECRHSRTQMRLIALGKRNLTAASAEYARKCGSLSVVESVDYGCCPGKPPLYRCVDRKGSVLLTDNPPPGAKYSMEGCTYQQLLVQNIRFEMKDPADKTAGSR